MIKVIVATMAAITISAIIHGSAQAPTQEIKLLPELQKICACESAGNKDAEPKHYNVDGSVVKNPKSSATGMCQILASLHGKDVERMGLGLNDRNGKHFIR